MRSVLSYNSFVVTGLTINVINSPGAVVTVASIVGNSLGGGGAGAAAPSVLEPDLRGFPGM
jgi:hypothetical protein